jgi:hypothetical protein
MSQRCDRLARRRARDAESGLIGVARERSWTTTTRPDAAAGASGLTGRSPLRRDATVSVAKSNS